MADDQKPARSPLWLRLVLIVSLALNLLIVGIVGGALLSPEGPRAQREQISQRLSGFPFFRALERDDRRELFRELRDKPAPQRATAAHVTPELVLTVIRAEPFEPEALAQIMEERRRSGQDRQMQGERALIAALTEMSPAERAAYADRLEDALKKRNGPKR